MKTNKLFASLLFALAAAATCLGQTSPTVRVDTVAELAAVPIPTTNSKFSAIVKSRGLYTYDSASAVATNVSGVVIAPLVGSGRWLMVTPAKVGVNTSTADLTNTFTLNQSSIVTAAVTSTYAMAINRGTTNALVIGVDDTNSYIRSVAGGLILQPTTGNVGIGETGPTSILQITSTGAPGFTFKRSDSVSGSGVIRFLGSDGVIDGRITFGNTATGAIALESNGTNVRMLIDNNGNVGIGTVTQAAKLSINGGAHIGGDSDPGDNNILVDGTTTSAGNVIISTAGAGLQLQSGSNARIGTSTLVNGTVTVSNTSVTTNTHIFVSRKSINGSTTVGALEGGTVVAGTSFVINSYTSTAGISPDDDSIVEWVLIEDAP